MPAPVLVHLIEPAAWRAALDGGAVRPPSLQTAGFVHLSTPDQVHLPARALFPGRQDMVLLAVDPRRLTDEVRWEPGAPRDPQGMRFPHLYGPLPVTAVVAVVPYRPPAPPVLPAPDDALGRGLALQLSLSVRRATEVREVPGGLAVVDRRFPHSYEDNRLLLDEPVAPETVAVTAEALVAEMGLRRPAATLRWAGAGEVARALARRGWETEEMLIMARPRAPLSGGEAAEVAARTEVHPLWERSWRELLGPRVGPAELEEIVGRLVGRAHRTDRVVAVTDVVVRAGGQVVAAGRLGIDGGTAMVDSVLTDSAARGRGHGAAILAGSCALAAEAGCDLVVLEARADDWPRHWYGRLGFREAGSVWEVTGPLRPGAAG